MARPRQAVTGPIRKGNSEASAISICTSQLRIARSGMPLQTPEAAWWVTILASMSRGDRYETER